MEKIEEIRSRAVYLQKISFQESKLKDFFLNK